MGLLSSRQGIVDLINLVDKDGSGRCAGIIMAGQCSIMISLIVSVFACPKTGDSTTRGD
jgi:hypothetical protein